MATKREIENWFTYHAPTAGQLDAYNQIRTAAKYYAEVVNEHVPDCADKTAALRKIRDSVMAANLAVACYQKPTIESLEELLKKEDDTPVTIKPDGSIEVVEG